MHSWLSLPLGIKPAAWPSGLALLEAIADGVIAVSFLGIAAALLYLYVRRPGRGLREGALLSLFMLLIVACGLAPLALRFSPWLPVQGLEAALKVVTALLAFAAAIVIWRLAPHLLALPSRDRLQAEIVAHLRTLEQLKAARHQLLRELTHRSKNLLAVIQAIARQTASRTRSVDDFLQHFSNRLVAIGYSHDLLIADDWHGASLRTLIERQLSGYTDRFGEHIAIDGEDIMLKPEAIHNLGLALHELVANAEKYGALSTDAGRVAIRWLFSDDVSKVEFVWEERDGPLVIMPERSGFGRAMIETVVRQALETDVTLTFPPEGVRCVILIPACQVAS
jgi:two-component sensor histidine kinase